MVGGLSMRGAERGSLTPLLDTIFGLQSDAPHFKRLLNVDLIIVLVPSVCNLSSA